LRLGAQHAGRFGETHHSQARSASASRTAAASLYGCLTPWIS
jgi:hypothetical protein